MSTTTADLRRSGLDSEIVARDLSGVVAPIAFTAQSRWDRLSRRTDGRSIRFTLPVVMSPVRGEFMLYPDDPCGLTGTVRTVPEQILTARPHNDHDREQ